MYVHVRLLNGVQDPLIYHVPVTWTKQDLIGALVRVPLRNRIEVGVVCKGTVKRPNGTFTIKDLLSVEPFPNDSFYQTFIDKLAQTYCVDSLHFIRRLRHFIAKHTSSTLAIESALGPAKQKSIVLTQQQQQVATYVTNAIDSSVYTPVLLHGVTGSGKTEVYKRAIQHAIDLNKSILFLVPEVTLALQFEHIFKSQCPELPIYGFHSGTTPKAKRKVWELLLESKPIVLIGVHVPVALPVANLGVIIVDEEHDVGYQEKKHPKLNSKEAALIRAHIYNIPILLGSATPSIASLYNVKTRGWKFFQLQKRFSGSFPTIQTVYLPEHKERKHFWITKELQAALADRLRKGEQSIIFLNRRGYSFFVQCKACSFIFECSSCAVSLTVHKDKQLRCHYCEFARAFPTVCTACKALEKQLIKKGIGTQQVVSILQKLFPHARIARADLDTTKKKKKWSQTVEQFNMGTLDIIVGTQTITKGFHFPNVTLVGIIWADLNFSFPFYNATETALQQLIQVAGRAGRGTKESLVIVQSMQKHQVLSFIHEQTYLSFFAQELAIRKRVQYPPFVRFIEIECKHKDEMVVEQDVHHLVTLLNRLADDYCTILGPAIPLVHKIKNYHVRKIYLKVQTISHVTKFFRSLGPHFKSSINFVFNPLS